MTAPPSGGRSLTADNGTWTGDPTGFAHQWLRCDAQGGNCADIQGATSSTYTLTNDDVGATIRVRVTASNAGGDTSEVSDPTAAITVAGPSNQAQPNVTGTAQVGETLTADEGQWTGTGQITYAYQWIRCDAQGGSCADISGATSSAYTTPSPPPTWTRR